MIKHICEVCGKEKLMTSDEAYAEGWDYPPFMGTFGMISPRTCGECPINLTLWWEIAVKGITPSQLSERHIETLKRILGEV